MRWLKKLAPIAIGAVFAFAATFGGAIAADYNLGNWDNAFPASTTAIVVGAGASDATAVVNIAGALGISAETTTYGEEYQIRRSTNELNLGDNVSDIKSSLDEDELPTLLADGTYLDSSNSEYKFEQKFTFAADTLHYTHFADTNYNSKEPSLGFHPSANDVMGNYSLDFTTSPGCTEAILETTTIDIMGHSYYLSDVNAACSKITFIDAADTAVVKDDGVAVTLNGRSVTTSFISNTETVLMVDGEETNSMSEGETYKLSDGTYVGVKDIRYNAKDTGVSSVQFTLGSGKLEVENNTYVEINDKDVLDLIGYVDVGSGTSNWSGITLHWKLQSEDFLTEDESLILPGFETMSLVLKDPHYPETESLLVNGGNDYLEITADFGGETGVTVPLLGLNSSGNISCIGQDTDQQLATSETKYLVYNESNAQNIVDDMFIASYSTSKEGVSYLLQAQARTDGTNNVTDIYRWEDGGWTSVKTDVQANDDFDVGDVTLTVNNIYVVGDYRWINFTGAAGVNFSRIYTNGGLMLWLPTNGDEDPNDHDLPGNVTIPSVTWKLVVEEADKDDTLGAGDDMNFTMTLSSNNKSSITTIATSEVAGTTNAYPSFESKETDDTYIGYEESDVGTYIVWDKTGDEYDVIITYPGEETYANLFVTSTVTSTSTESSVAIKDTEIDNYKTHNLAVIGGSGVNMVATDALGLTDADADGYVYGSEEEWQTATGVTGTGKALLKLMTSPYASDKYAIVIAGWDATDTERAAKALTTPIEGLSGETSVVLNTVEEVATIVA